MKAVSVLVLSVILLGVWTIPAEAGDRWLFGKKRVTGSGDLVTEEREVDNFTRISASGSFDVYVVVGKERSVKITFDDNLIDMITTRVHGKTLELDSEGSWSSRRSCRIDITVPELEQYRSSGSGDIELERLSGPLFEGKISGSGDMIASGEVDEVEIVISGSGDVDFRDLKARTAYAKVSGSGDIKIYAEDDFVGSVSGSGDIVCYGNPQSHSKRISGSGSIRLRK